MENLKQYSKAIVAAIGLLLVILTSLQGVMGDDLPSWVPILIAVLTSVSVYLAPNRQATDTEVAQHDSPST